MKSQEKIKYSVKGFTQRIFDERKQYTVVDKGSISESYTGLLHFLQCLETQFGKVK